MEEISTRLNIHKAYAANKKTLKQHPAERQLKTIKPEKYWAELEDGVEWQYSNGKQFSINFIWF